MILLCPCLTLLSARMEVLSRLIHFEPEVFNSVIATISYHKASVPLRQSTEHKDVSEWPPEGVFSIPWRQLTTIAINHIAWEESNDFFFPLKPHSCSCPILISLATWENVDFPPTVEAAAIPTALSRTRVPSRNIYATKKTDLDMEMIRDIWVNQ